MLLLLPKKAKTVGTRYASTKKQKNDNFLGEYTQNLLMYFSGQVFIMNKTLILHPKP